MSLRMALFGPRWGLTFQHDRERRYELYGDSVYRIVGTVITFYKNGGRPVHPWSLWLYSYKAKSGFEVKPWHFTADGENVTSDLISAIRTLDPGIGSDGDPIFEDVKTGKKYPLYGKSLLDRMLEGGDAFDLANRGENGYDIIRGIFGQSR